MEFTPRDRQILLTLLSEKEVISVKNLSQKVNVSKRTVQRELDYISYILKNYKISLCSKTGAGIWLEGEESQKQKLLDLLENQDELDFADKSERRNSLILELLRDQSPKKLYYYANLFSVSEATVSKDMEQIEPWFQKFDLQIIRKQGYGVSLQGSEKKFREAIRYFIAKYMDTPILNQLFEENDTSTPKMVGVQKIKSHYQLLDEEIIKRVGTCLASIPDDRIKRITEESYIGLLLHVTIAIERLQNGEVIESNAELLNKLKEDKDYNLALLIVNSLEKEFSIEIPDIEIAFICLHIKGSKIQRANEEENDAVLPDHKGEIKDLVQGIIIAYDSKLADILSADEDFVNGLSAHLRPTLVRLRNQMPIENPHLNEIKESYSEVYENCIKVARFLEEKIGYLIPEAEIGYLAIHFGAAIVRLESEKEKKRTVNVGLVCASGIGISRLMSSKLQKYLKSRAILTTYGKIDLNPFVLERNDFFVSNMDLGDLEADILQVSPLLSEGDLQRIDLKVKQYELTPKKREHNSDFTKQMEKINDLAGRIKELLHNFICIQVEGEVNFHQLLETAAKNITPYKENQVRIIENIRKREEIATQMIPELGIGLLHARVNGITEAGFYVCIPSQNKMFSHPDLQSIEAAIVMLIPEDEHKQENTQLLGYLSENLIEDHNFLTDIKSGDGIRIKDTLSRLLKQYFNQYLDVV